MRALRRVRLRPILQQRRMASAEAPPRTPIPLMSKPTHDVLFGPSERADSARMTYATSPEAGIEALGPGPSVLAQFAAVGEELAGPYKELLGRLAALPCPPPPPVWETRAGWTMYAADGSPEPCDGPPDAVFVLDVEVASRVREAPVLAVALGPSGWLSWAAPSLDEPGLDVGPGTPPRLEELIPLAPRGEGEPSVIVGHHVAYDRSFVGPAYGLGPTGRRWWDTMSVHIALDGLTVDQQNTFAALTRRKGLKETSDRENDWLESRSRNNLKDVHAFHCPQSALQVSKDLRNVFVTGSMDDIRGDLQNLFQYCAEDVLATLEIHQATWGRVQNQLPHPATLVGMLEMSTSFLPVSRAWERYVAAADAAFDAVFAKGLLLFQSLARRTRVELQGGFARDPWMWSEDWALRPARRRPVAKGEAKAESVPEALPIWYRKLCPPLGPRETALLPPSELTSRKHVTAKLLRLTWNGYPLYHSKSHGWGYLNPSEKQLKEEMAAGLWEVDEETGNPVVPSELKSTPDRAFPFPEVLALVQANREGLPGSAHNAKLAVKSLVPGCTFYKLPHNTKAGLNVGNPLSAGMMTHLDSGVLRTSGESAEAAEVAHWAKSISYWTGNRKRIKQQLIVWTKPNTGVILPRLVVAGTVTRRAVEKTWMTASNPMEDRIGSELKSMVEAPPGFVFVGADVDSQEQWIAAMLGDQYAAKRGGETGVGLSEFSWACLVGSKTDGTDLHSLVAQKVLTALAVTRPLTPFQVGISRTQAKTLNYARLYGGGVKLAEASLRRSAASMDKAAAREIAEKLFALTKGRRNDAGEWAGGSESDVFAAMEALSKGDVPRTPVLGAAISTSLQRSRLTLLGYAHEQGRTRSNWTVQSSGVDFLHLLLTAMRSLCTRHHIRASFLISIHDEIRFMVAAEDRYRAALALQLAHLFVRAAFLEALGLPFLPSCVGFFSTVDVDRVLRKEPDHESVTPSNPRGLSQEYGIPPGEALSMADILEKTQGFLSAASVSDELSGR